MSPFPPLAPTKILAVENEAIVCLEIADWLAELGLSVQTAREADEAIARIAAGPGIEILMTDIEMPGEMDGLALARYVRDLWPHMGIIVSSGLVDTPLSDLPAGCAFIPKPFEPRMLWAVLARMTGALPSN